MDVGSLPEDQRAIFDYWQAKATEVGLPSRADIDPLELRNLLPFVGLIDVERPPGRIRFRYRLIGTYMVEMFGEDFTGTYADESKRGSYGDFLHDLYSDAAENRRPVYSESVFGYRGKRGDIDKSYLRIGRLIMPLADGDAPVNMLLFTNKFSPRHRESLRRPYRQADLVEAIEEQRRY